MKKLLLTITISMVFLCACSNKETTNTNDKNETKTTIETTENKETTEDTKDNAAIIEDKEVEIIHSLMDNTMTIAEYVDKINKENKNKNYYVYDNEHYAEKMKDSARKEILKALEPKEFLLQMNGEYPNVFTDMKYNKDTKDVSIYVNNSLYQEADFGVGFYALIIGALYSDECQAYELVLPNDRTGNVYIIDNATNEVLYSTIE